MQLVQQSDISISQTIRNLGINDNVLRCWCKEFSEPAKAAFPGHGSARDQEVAKLKWELQQVKKERDFLKEVAVYFAREPR